jgi:hypothetical protein
MFIFLKGNGTKAMLTSIESKNGSSTCPAQYLDVSHIQSTHASFYAHFIRMKRCVEGYILVTERVESLVRNVDDDRDIDYSFPYTFVTLESLLFV